jgi:hypothetical protein
MVRKELMPGLLTIGLTVVIVGLLLFGMFAVPRSRAGEAPVSPAFYDWGRNSRATFSWAAPKSHYNSIQVTRVVWRRNTRDARTFEYMTGGQAGIADADALASARLKRPPDRLLAKHQEGKVLVRIWGEGQAAGSADEFVLRTARALHLATTQIWPREPTPIQADIYVMPENVAYSLARKVRWKSGRPLELAIFIPGAANAESHRMVVTHELYHVLAAFLRIGRWTTNGAGRPNASTGFEEVAATSFASCGELLADGYLSRPRTSNSYLINGVPMKQPLSTSEVKDLLGGLRYADAHSLSDIGTRIGGLLDTTLVFQVLESGQERIELHSPQGEQLLEMCREFAPDPLKIEHWLENLGQEQVVPPG